MSQRHPHLLRSEDSLLLVIDLQQPFLREVQHRERVVRNCGFLLDAAAKLGVPAQATVQYQERMGGVVPEIQRRIGREPLDKLCFSCAADESIARTIADTGRNQVLVCGVETHICVCQTALDLVARGFQVHVAVDSVSARFDSAHENGLAKMAGAGVIQTTAEGAVYELLYAAGTPKFKEILKLVKDAAQ